MRLVVVVVVAALIALTFAPAADAGPHRSKPVVIDVSGTYSSTYDQVQLWQHGSQIEGEYVCCGGGTIEARIVGRVIKYHWAQSDGTEGDGVWRVVSDGKLVGTWGRDGSADDGGEWNLDRVGDNIAN
jgi:hypothetical protein